MKKPNRLRRALSFNQYRKRWGGRRHVSQSLDFEGLKASLIDLGAADQTRGSTKSLDQHLMNLRQEFSGQPELLWHHAKLIVLIRRGVRVKEQYAQFRSLWEAEAHYLCENLNIRWLVSATDTFAEHDPDPTIRAVAMMTSVLVNTIKMQESERYITHAESASFDQARIDEVQHTLVPLFEGMSCFTVGTDDTLRNMMWRLEPFMTVAPSGLILAEIWRRIQTPHTVFGRMRDLHQRDKTRWWEG